MAVTGIGGFFFRSKDTKALAAWYLEHLGVGAPEGVYLWNQQAGPTVFSPFKADTDYFAADKQWMLNLRVDDLDGMIASLTAAGIEVITKAEWDAYARDRPLRPHPRPRRQPHRAVAAAGGVS